MTNQEIIKSLDEKIINSLNKHVNKEVFKDWLASQLNKLNQNDLKTIKIDSIENAVMKCARDGLLLDGKEAMFNIISRKIDNNFVKEIQYTPMIQGILKQLYLTKKIKSLKARTVFNEDEFIVEYGLNEQLKHIPKNSINNKIDPKKNNNSLKDCGIKASYAIVKLDNDEVLFEVLTVDELDTIRGKSKSANSGSWVDFTAEMCEKVVIRNLLKRLPFIEEVSSVFAHDDEYSFDEFNKKSSVIPVDPLSKLKANEYTSFIDYATIALKKMPLDNISRPRILELLDKSEWEKLTPIEQNKALIKIKELANKEDK